MKNMKLLLNPFVRIAGLQSLVIGLVMMVVTSVIAYYANIVFDGVLDIHITAQSVTWGQAFLYPFISVAVLILISMILAVMAKSHFRVIDLVGTILMTRIPFIIGACCGFFVQLPDVNTMVENPASILQTSIILTGICTVFVIIWHVVLYVNAMRVSCNMSGKTLSIVTIIGIVVSEILSKFILTWLF